MNIKEEEGDASKESIKQINENNNNSTLSRKLAKQPSISKEP